MHVVCKWIGNSQPVAAEHYLQLTDEHFERAIAGPAAEGAQAAQNAAQKPPEEDGNGEKAALPAKTEGAGSSGDFESYPKSSQYFPNEKAPRRGLEPLLPG
jgi:hypothetical protein